MENSPCCSHSLLLRNRDQPVHLYDAYSGTVRATYRPYNAVDEMESPTVVEFSTDSQRLFCGGFRSDRVIHIFDVAVPGRDSTVLRLGKTRRSTDGQKGLVSVLALTHDDRYFGVGTYAPGSIYVYDNRAGHFSDHTVLNGLCIVGHGRSHSRRKRRFVDLESSTAPADSSSNSDGDAFIRQAKTKWFQTRAQGGVTQLKFAPNQEYLLYSASRRSDSVLTWDLRMLSDTNESHPVRGIGSFRTASNTNQRLEFDLNDDGSILYVGGMDRCVRIYDTKSGKSLGTIDALEDVANGVSFARLSNKKSYLAVASGSRRFKEKDEEEEEGDDQHGENYQPPEAPGHLRVYQLNDTIRED